MIEAVLKTKSVAKSALMGKEIDTFDDMIQKILDDGKDNPKVIEIDPTKGNDDFTRTFDMHIMPK